MSRYGILPPASVTGHTFVIFAYFGLRLMHSSILPGFVVRLWMLSREKSFNS